MVARDVRSMTEIDRAVDTKTSPTEAETVEAPARPDEEQPPKKERKKRRTITIFKWAVPVALVEWVVLIGSALVIALLIKTFLFQAFYIPSESMRPTLNVGDRVLVNKMSYRLHDVNRGDIVVFETPPNTEDANGRIKDLVKRVIALPGETIETRDGVVYINGRQLEEPYLQDGVRTCAPNTDAAACANYGPRVIPSDQVFVMGDNRGASKDGRSFGPIEESSIVGRVFVRIWPLTDIGFL
jgi:signal peptidase I